MTTLSRAEQVFDELKKGQVMLRVPEGCSASASHIMNECLRFAPATRPPFAELDRRLSALDSEGFQSPAFFASEKPDYSQHSIRFLEPARRRRSMSIAADSRQSRTDDIMRSLFPPHVVDALLAGQKVPPERKEMITMYFRCVGSVRDHSACDDPTLQICLPRALLSFTFPRTICTDALRRANLFDMPCSDIVGFTKISAQISEEKASTARILILSVHKA